MMLYKDVASTNKGLRRSLTKVEAELAETKTQQQQCLESLDEQKKKIEHLETLIKNLRVQKDEIQ